MRKSVTHGYFVRAVHPSRQLVEVIHRFDLGRLIALFERCLRCNGKLIRVEKKVIVEHLEPKTRLYYEEFSRCSECNRIYWKGSPYEKIERFVSSILMEVEKALPTVRSQSS